MYLRMKFNRLMIFIYVSAVFFGCILLFMKLYLVNRVHSPVKTQVKIQKLFSYKNTSNTRPNKFTEDSGSFPDTFQSMQSKENSSLSGQWCDTGKKIYVTPVSGFGNRMRALVSAFYMALATRRKLVIIWKDLTDLMDNNKRTPCVEWTGESEHLVGDCKKIDCASNSAYPCFPIFEKQKLQTIFPNDQKCVWLISFTSWDRFLLNNAEAHGSLNYVTNLFATHQIYKVLLGTLGSDIVARLASYQQQFETYDRVLSLHIRTGADKQDGGKIKNLYNPQILCAINLQKELQKKNLTSAVFLESDSVHVKQVAQHSGLHNVIMIDKHAERENVADTVLYWLLFGESDILLGSHTSSLSMTAAQRVGTVPFQLPNKFSLRLQTPSGEITQECQKDNLKSTQTHDAVYTLTPTECADIFPNCPHQSIFGPF